MEDITVPFSEIHYLSIDKLGNVPVTKGDFISLPSHVQAYLAQTIQLCKPASVHICDGSQEEADMVTKLLLDSGTIAKLPKYENCYICRTDPRDVARVESKTFIVTNDKYQSVPHSRKGTNCILGLWKSPEDIKKDIDERLPGCMAGRTLYVIPFSMGPIGSPLSKIGVQLTDSNYVMLSMRIMTRVSSEIWNHLRNGEEFVRCLHSVGVPLPTTQKIVNNWPCNPEKTMIVHFPDSRKVISFGSGYGGNSLLGKKCFALRIAGRIAYDEDWFAEHMLIMSVTNPKGEEKFVAASFPSACGKTNLAMLTPAIPGYKIKCVGDDIAWMRFDKETGELRAINPEAGFFGVAPGTNMKTNPNAILTCLKNSIFTNIGETADGGFYWEGLEDETPAGTEITSWLGEKYKLGEDKTKKSSHPNSRFCCPARQCPIIHEKWEDPAGVPISAIIFGGRRPEGVPLVIESFNWKHGVFLASQLKSEATAAAEHAGKEIMHDPFAMRPFVGYNFGKYIQHWLDFEKNPKNKLPKIFHVNWFRVDEHKKFLWPGFGDNIRVLDWVIRRVNNEDIAEKSAVGLLPKKGSINLQGINVEWDKLLSLPKEYWAGDIEETLSWLDGQLGDDLPPAIRQEIQNQKDRISHLK
jgi:phosphoenolpyruvate carboxykinase (GTP)